MQHLKHSSYSLQPSIFPPPKKKKNIQKSFNQNLHGLSPRFSIQHLDPQIAAKELVGSQVLGEDGAERRVGAVHPAPWRHAVGHVHDLVLGHRKFKG